MAKLLIVDDDSRIRKLVRAYGEIEGLLCEEAAGGRAALHALEKENFDLVVLDVMMPEMDGFETLEKIRKISNVPVIMLTARSEEYDKLLGFRLGVDDYVSKPFSPRELAARMMAVLKRSGPKREILLEFDGLIISGESRSVTIDGKPLSLPPKEFDLLLLLARNERIVLKREQILEAVWDYSYYGDGRTVDTHVKSLRDHLGPYRRFIKTVWGVGYKFEKDGI